MHGAEWACTLQHCSRVESKHARGPSHPPAVSRHAPAGPGGCWPGQEPHCTRDCTAVHAAESVAHAAAAAGQLHRIPGLSQVRCQSVRPGLPIDLSFRSSLSEEFFRRCQLRDLSAEAGFRAEASAAWHQHKPGLLSVADGPQLWGSEGPSALLLRTACGCCCCKCRQWPGHTGRITAGVSLSRRAEQGEQSGVHSRTERHQGSASSLNVGSGFRSDAIALEVSMQERLHDLQAQAGTRPPEQQRR